MKYIKDEKLTRDLSSLYYSPNGYWKGVTAIKNLATLSRTGGKSRPDGRSIYHHRDAFHYRNATYLCLTKSTRPTYYFRFLE